MSLLCFIFEQLVFSSPVQLNQPAENMNGVESLGPHTNALLLLSWNFKEYDIVLNCLEHAVTCDVTPHSQPCPFTELPP